MKEIQIQSLGGEDPLEKGMATHSSILAWKIPWLVSWGCKEPDMTEHICGGMGKQRPCAFIQKGEFSTLFFCKGLKVNTVKALGAPNHYRL